MQGERSSKIFLMRLLIFQQSMLAIYVELIYRRLTRAYATSVCLMLMSYGAGNAILCAFLSR
jgi:hypothetical protein